MRREMKQISFLIMMGIFLQNSSFISHAGEVSGTVGGAVTTDSPSITISSSKGDTIAVTGVPVGNPSYVWVKDWKISVKAATVSSGNVGLMTGGNAYAELRNGANGSYISDNSTAAINLLNLDTAIGKTSGGNYIVAQDGTATANVATNLTNLDTKIGAAKGVTGLYVAESDVESQIQAVGNKTIQSITNAVSNDASDAQKITVKTYDGTTTNIEIAGQGAVASGDVRLLNGNTVYNELRPTDGNYIKQGNTTAANLTVLDTQVRTNANNIINLGDRIDILSGKTDTRINTLTGEVHQIAASAAALAALRPETFDPGDKWSFAVGYGHYKNANAAALGVFYKPNAETTFSLGGTIGYDDSLMNAGISFKLGSRSKKAGTYQNAKDLVSRIQAIETAATKRDTVIAAQAKELAAVKANSAKEIAALRADNEKRKKQIAQILSKMEMADKVKKTAK